MVDVPEHLRRDAVTYGESLSINPYRALLDEVNRSAGHVEWLRLQLQGREALELLDTSSAASRWQRLYSAERGKLFKAAATCIQLGLAERQVELAERQGALVARLLTGVADRLGLSDAQRQVLPQLLQAELHVIESETDNDEEDDR